MKTAVSRPSPALRFDKLNWVASLPLPRDREPSHRLHEPDHLINTIDPITGHDIDPAVIRPFLVDGNLTIYFENEGTRAAWETMPMNHPYEHSLGQPSDEMDRGG